MAMCCLPKQVVPRECCYAAIQLSSLLAPRPLSPLLPSPLSAPLLSPPLSSLRPSPLSAPLISPPFSSLRSSPLLAPPHPHGWQGRTAAVQGPMLIFDFACCSVVAWNDCPLLALPPFLSPGMAGPDSIASDGASAAPAAITGAAEEEEGERGEGEGEERQRGAGRNDEDRGGRSGGEEEDEVFEEEGDEEVVIPVKVIIGPEGGDKGWSWC
ncbi:unnamed protein product [Closterium sp. NIES-64]|nr:unnamed protein product [Closterium sp. NIES-64]